MVRRDGWSSPAAAERHGGDRIRLTGRLVHVSFLRVPAFSRALARRGPVIRDQFRASAHKLRVASRVSGVNVGDRRPRLAARRIPGVRSDRGLLLASENGQSSHTSPNVLGMRSIRNTSSAKHLVFFAAGVSNRTKCHIFVTGVTGLRESAIGCAALGGCKPPRKGAQGLRGDSRFKSGFGPVPPSRWKRLPAVAPARAMAHGRKRPPLTWGTGQLLRRRAS